MKKLMMIASLIFSVVLLSGCAAKNDVKPIGNNTIPPDTNQKLTIKDYFSYKENTKYVYEGKGNEYATYSVLVDYLVGDRVQLRLNNGGTETIKVLENKNGMLTMLLSKGETYYRENLTQGTGNTNEVLLKEPLVKGTTWTLSDNSKRYISNVDVEVTVPSGKYKAIEVTTEGKDGNMIEYYAPNVGLIKGVFTFNGAEVSSSLGKMEKDALLTQTVKFFYPNGNDDKLYFANKQLSFNTNDITKMILEKAYKDLPKGNIGKVLSTNAKIKSLYLNKDNIVYVDLTKEFVSEMNAGSGYEGIILQGITNTLGTYYGVDKVYITVEGSPYTSGHIVMKKGEYFTVNLKNSVEFK